MSPNELRSLLVAMTVRPLDRATLREILRECAYQPSIAASAGYCLARSESPDKESREMRQANRAGPTEEEALAFQQGALFALGEILMASGFRLAEDGSSAAMAMMRQPAFEGAEGSGSAALERPGEWAGRRVPIAWLSGGSGSVAIAPQGELAAQAEEEPRDSAPSGGSRGEREMVELMALCQECPEFHSLDGCRAMAPDQDLTAAWEKGRCPEERW